MIFKFWLSWLIINGTFIVNLTKLSKADKAMVILPLTTILIQSNNRIKMQSYEFTHILAHACRLLISFHALHHTWDICNNYDVWLIFATNTHTTLTASLTVTYINCIFIYFLWGTLNMQFGKHYKLFYLMRSFLNRMPYLHLLLKQTLDYEHQLKILILDDLNHLYSVQKLVTSSSYKKY